MSTSLAVFKKAFAGKCKSDVVVQLNAQVAAALKRLQDAVGNDADAGLQAALKKLMERYEKARNAIGDPGAKSGDELADVLKQAKFVFGALEQRSQTRRANGVAGGAGAILPKQDAAATPLGRQIREAIAAGGINIAIYFVGDPDKNNDREFKRQASAWAGNHGAFGLSGSKLSKDCPMPLSEDPGKLVTDLLAAVQRELKTSDIVPIANVALFSHGGQTSMKIDSQGQGGGEKWASSGSKVVKDFAAAVKPALTAGAKIHLFACTAAKDRDATKGADDATRKDSFAEALEQMTGAEVWGHENAAHTTGNTRLVEIGDDNLDGNAERHQIRDVFARKFLLSVDSKLTDPQMGYLDQKLKIGDWIKDSLVSVAAKKLQKKGLSKEEKKKLTNEVDQHQVFVEEISMMGFDRVFDLLIPSTPPTEATFRALFPEHDQIDKLVEGAAAVHAEFHRSMAAKVAAIAEAKRSPEFPVLVTAR